MLLQETVSTNPTTERTHASQYNKCRFCFATTTTPRCKCVCVTITSETGLLSACSRHHRQRHTLSHWVALSHTSTRRDRIGAQRPPQTPTTARRSRAVRPNSCVLCQCSPAPILASTSAAAAAATTRSVGLFGVRACVVFMQVCL